ncbi:MAG: beta-mannosidase [Frankiales bacterium]|nr:beta-mannosidase [Frankiales bacterium]
MTLTFELAWTIGDRPGPDAEWVPAVVPGGVHESLMAAGRLPHPYFGMNEHDLGWVEDATWWYRARFTADPATDRFLDFAGLDTVAVVWLNGVQVGSARNQHRPHRFEVSLAADNELLVAFPPPLVGLLSDDAAAAEIGGYRERSGVRPDAEEVADDVLLLRVQRPRLRKATFSWGWDFAAALPSRGISGAVTVVAGEPVLRDVWVRAADVDVEVRTATLVVTGQSDAAVTVTVTSPSGAVQTALAGAGAFRTDVMLTDVELWWTHDLGTPALYDVEVRSGDAVVTVQRGLRTIELDRSPDPEEQAEHFRFVLNGQPTFSRGANVVPPSMLVGSVPDATQRDLVELSRDAGMTMLRVWGGGVVAPDAFYDACDELGVLVWQDFLFACYDYPDPDGTLAVEIGLEAAHQVRRLRGRTSLALWCGENEIQAIREITSGTDEPGEWGWSIFNELLPDAVRTHDPDAIYWPGSPWGKLPGELLNGTGAGDRHAWEVWHGADVGAGGPTEFASRGEQVHFSRYEHDKGRFISEFGIHASPELATLERWTPPGSLDLGSAELGQRNKDTPKDKGYAQMILETGEPRTLLEYVDRTMACQAEGLKLGIEHYRRRQPHCNGTLVWQLNDAWPGLSWSVLDYDLVPKASYYFLQRVFQPLLASFRTTDTGVELWVTNSGRDAVDLDLAVCIGAVKGGEVRRDELQVVAEAYSSVPVWTLAEVPPVDQFAHVSEASGLLPDNRRFFGRLKDVLPEPALLEPTVLFETDGITTVRLTARGYAYLARVMSDLPGARFSTNYVDLRDGESVDIAVCRLPEGATLTAACYGGPAVPVR